MSEIPERVTRYRIDNGGFLQEHSRGNLVEITSAVPAIREQVLADAKARIEGERIESDGMDSWENGYHVGIEAALAALTQPQTEKMCPVCRNVGPPGYKSRRAGLTKSLDIEQRGSHGLPSSSRKQVRFNPDHLGWHKTSPDQWQRLSPNHEGGVTLTTVADSLTVGSAEMSLVNGQVIELPPESQEFLPRTTIDSLGSVSATYRVGTFTVWEAAATAVLRQVVTRGQAGTVFNRFCSDFGERTKSGINEFPGFPTAETVLRASDDQLRATRMGFKAKTMRALAEWSLEVPPELPSDELHDALLRVKGIGYWSAGIAVSDLFSDFAFYPIEDLAIRTKAKALWPEVAWPDSPKDFAKIWSQKTGPYTPELTALFLAESTVR